jgi:putative ABC transport system permease protein
VLWFEHENTRYEVIGILGEEKKSSNLDDMILISFAPYLDDDVRFHYNGEYVIDHEASRKIYNSVQDFIIELDSNAVIKKIALDEYVPSFFAVVMKSQILSQILLSLALVLALNIVNISVYWVTARKKKIGIKKMLGATNLKLALEIIFEYQILTFLGFMAGWLLYQWIRTLPMMTMIRGENSIHLFYIIIAYVLCSLIGLITAIIPAYRVIHLQPSDSIKG